jgi:hypothetical protein
MIGILEQIPSPPDFVRLIRSDLFRAQREDVNRALLAAKPGASASPLHQRTHRANVCQQVLGAEVEPCLHNLSSDCHRRLTWLLPEVLHQESLLPITVALEEPGVQEHSTINREAEIQDALVQSLCPFDLVDDHKRRPRRAAQHIAGIKRRATLSQSSLDFRPGV